LAKAFSGRVLHPRAGYSKDRRIVLCHATEKSRLVMACATDHALETSCTYVDKTVYADDVGCAVLRLFRDRFLSGVTRTSTISPGLVTVYVP
jgi:hypothetical protein